MAGRAGLRPGDVGGQADIARHAHPDEVEGIGCVPDVGAASGDAVLPLHGIEFGFAARRGVTDGSLVGEDSDWTFGPASWLQFRTAGRLHRFRLHQFGAGKIRIVEIELPFAVAADFGLLRRRRLPGLQDLCRRIHFGHAKRDVVHDAARLRRPAGLLIPQKLYRI